MTRLARVFAGAWGAAIVAALAIGAFGSAGLQADLLSSGPGCPFRAATGVDCPFCGMTRATIALGRGDLDAALGFHPLAPVVLIALLAVLAMIAAGRGDALMRGRRSYVLLVAIGVAWVLRFALS